MKKETFDFSEALRRMKEGKKVRRIGWGIVENYGQIKIKISTFSIKQQHILRKVSFIFFQVVGVISLAKIFSQQTGRRCENEEERKANGILG